MLPGSPSPGWVPTLPVADPPPVLDALAPTELPEEPDAEPEPLDALLPDAPVLEPDAEPELDAEACKTSRARGAPGTRASEAWSRARESRIMEGP